MEHLEEIPEKATLHWMTDTISLSIWHNRTLAQDADAGNRTARTSVVSSNAHKLLFVEKPCEYSQGNHSDSIELGREKL